MAGVMIFGSVRSTRGSTDGEITAAVVKHQRRAHIASQFLSETETVRYHVADVTADNPNHTGFTRVFDTTAPVTVPVTNNKRPRKTGTEEDNYPPIVGTKVDENHVHYEVAYNMLTGIRFTVSRTQAKLDRALTAADFTQQQKFSFDMIGTELTPSVKYDFKFKDYAPWVFRKLRQNFGIDASHYLMSVTNKYIVNELGSPGKSGSFFYFTRDYQYIIKTVHHSEAKFLRKILPDYYKHVVENPDTLLSQFYGLHRVKLPYGRKIHFVVMNNLMPPHRDIHSVYDLKGSTVGRDYNEEKLKKVMETKPKLAPTLKDLNWLRRDLKLELGPAKKQKLADQLERDVALLQRLKIMDYSLLVGTHDLQRGNRDRLRDRTLQVFEPGSEKATTENGMPQPLNRTPSKLEHAKRVRELRESVKKERPVPIAATDETMPEGTDRKGYFYQEHGGIQATDDSDTPSDTVYYIGIIDCLTRYSLLKKAEHFFKGLGGDEPLISPIPPQRYGERFVRFIKNITASARRN